MFLRLTLLALVVPLRCSLLGPEHPPLREVRIGPWSAVYRSYAGSRASLCDSEGSWLLEEMRSVDELLEAFLAKARGGAWKDSELPLIEEAAAALGPVLEAHRQNLSAARGCAFSRTEYFPAMLDRSEARAKAAAAQLAELPGVISFAQHRLRYERWDRQRQGEELLAKAQCGGPSLSAPNAIYHAYRDDLGAVRWLFCDGAVVSSANGGPYQLEVAAEHAKLKEAEYFLAARMYAQVKASP